jgi:drug/metabolite transporter (DMT)-like permease
VVDGNAGGEHPSAVQLAGIVAAVVGVVLASREPEPEHAPHPQRRIARMSIVLALVAALGFGSFAVGLRSSARADVLWSLVAARGAGVAALCAAFFAARAPRSPLGTGVIVIAAMGTLDLVSNGLYALATRHGLLSIVAVAASLYPLATVTLARSLLGERVRRSQEVGILAAIAGIALIAAG